MLGLPRGAPLVTRMEVSRAQRRLLLIVHPDKVPEALAAEATLASQVVNESADTCATWVQG